MQELIFESHPLFLFLCLILGLGYAFFLYRKKGTWSENTNKVLFALRALLVFLISALLVSPMLRQLINEAENPVVVMAVDNSESLSAVRDSIYLQSMMNRLAEMTENLKQNGFEVAYKYLDNSTVGRQSFDVDKTDLASLLNSIESEYEGRNLAKVVLMSDGIYNQGISPSFLNYNFEINTIGIGDTIPKSDISINALLFNRLSYQGNKFPIVAQIKHQGYENELVTVSVSKAGTTLSSKQLALSSSGSLQNVEFLIESSESGFQRYLVSVSRKQEELTYDNNAKSAYVEVIEGREKIVLLGSSPHPDIKALRTAIESNSNYEFEQYILSDPTDVAALRTAPQNFDLVIFHQLPSRVAIDRSIVNTYKDKFSSLYIIGSQTDLRLFNATNPLLTIESSKGDYDNINAAFNQVFEKFNLSDELQGAFNEFPPLVVPFGNYTLKGQTESLLYQQVGSIVTTKPLLAVGSINENKSAVMTSSGLWKWKLADYANNGNNNLFNELVTKLVQYLSTKDDKRKFRVYPLKNEYANNEPIIFEAEIYNDLYEEIYGVTVDIKLRDADEKEYDYSYTTSEISTQFEISGMSEGVYEYQASASLQGNKETTTGQIVVKNLKLETINLTADFELLRDIASSSGGDFYGESELDKLINDVSASQPVKILHSKEKLLPIININWLLFLLLVLISAEWFLRKYHGSY